MAYLQKINLITSNLTPWCLSLNFFLFAAALFFSRKSLKKNFCSLDKKTYQYLFLIFIGGLLLRFFWALPHHAIYVDEPWYMQAAKYLIYQFNFADYPKSSGWPFILALFFIIFGINNWVAIYTSIIFGALSIILLFFFIYFLINKKKLALISAAIFAIMPLHIKWSATAETNVVSLFFILLFLVLFSLYLIRQKRRFLLLVLFSLGLVVQFRPENYLLFIFFIVVVAIYRRKNFSLMSGFVFLGVILLSLPNLFTVMNFQFGSNWLVKESNNIAAGHNWSIGNFINNTIHYPFYVPEVNSGYYMVLTILCLLIAVYGSVQFRRRYKKEFWFLLSYFILYYLAYYSSWLQTMARSRFYLTFYPVTIIFFAVGFSRIYDIFIINKKYIWQRLFLFIIIIVLYMPFMKLARQYNNMGLLETMAPELAEENIATSDLVVAALPSILKSTTNLDVVSFDQFLSLPRVKQRSIIQVRNIFLFSDFYAQKFYNQRLGEIKNKFIVEPFIQLSCGQDTIYLYRLKLK